MASKNNNLILGKYLIGALTLAVLMVFNLPWGPEYFSYDIDSSWIFALHEAFVKEWQFGQEVVWHYGPMGFLYAKHYHPDTYFHMFVWYLVLSAVFFSAIYTIITKSHKNPNLLALPIIAIIASQSYDAFFLVFPVLFFVHSLFIDDKNNVPINWILVLACAFISHIKISYLLLSVFIIFVVQIYILINKRSLPDFLLGFVFSYLIIWFLLGQSLANLPGFIYGAIEHGRGFGAAMAFPDMPVLALVFYIIGALLFTIFVRKSIISMSKNKGKNSLANFTAVLMTGIFLLGLKSGFLIGNDSHIFEAVALFIITILLLRDFFFAGLGKNDKTVLMVYSGIVVFCLIIAMHSEKNKNEVAKFIGIINTASSISDSLVVEERKEYTAAEKHAFALSQIRKRATLLALRGKTDLYNNNQIALFASGANYVPRPVMQSYHTFTPHLANLNKKHLTSDKAPENIIFNIDAVMNHYPSVDDAISWPELLTRYDVIRINNQFIYLQKIAEPRKYEITKLDTIYTNFNEEMSIDENLAGKAIWANVEITPTIIGRLASFFLRNASVDIKFVTRSGYVRTNRIIPAVASEGFLLSPLVDNQVQYAVLAREGAQGLKNLALGNLSIQLENDNWFNDLLYYDDIKITLSELLFIPQTEFVDGWWKMQDMIKLTMHPLESFVAPIENVTDKHIDYSVYGEDRFIRINGASRLYYDLSEKQKNVKADFGIFNQFYFLKDMGDLVKFVIYGVNKDGEEERLWERNLDGLEQTEAVRNDSLNLDFKPGIYDGLIFETQPAQLDKSNWEYWANVEIK